MPRDPAGVKLRANGCAALDAVLHGAGLLAPLHETIAAARGGLRNVPGLGGAGAQLASGLRRIEQGAAGAATGDVCPGARRVRAGLRTVKGAAQSAAKLIEGLQAKVMAEQLAPAFGDTADKDMQSAELHLRLRLVDSAVGDATDVQKAYGAACAGLGPKTVVRGRITKVDDAAGLLWLGSERFLLPRRRFGNRIAEQGVVKLVARRVKGGPDLVTSVTPQAASASADTLSKVPCMKLRIAPAQTSRSPARSCTTCAAIKRTEGCGSSAAPGWRRRRGAPARPGATALRWSSCSESSSCPSPTTSRPTTRPWRCPW